MENKIKWSVKVGKQTFLNNLKNPKTIIAFVIGFFILAEIIAKLVDELNVNWISIYAITVVVLVILIIYSLKTNKLMLGADKILNYEISDNGISVDGKFWEWSEFSYFQDEHLLRQHVTPSIIQDIKPEVYIISLLKKRMSDKDKLVLFMENEDIYTKVSRVVGSKLTDALNLK